jgi:hypothetical protein
MTTSHLLYITIIPETSSGTIWKTQKRTSWININTVLLLTMTDARERLSISRSTVPDRNVNAVQTPQALKHSVTIYGYRYAVATTNWFP